MDQNKEGRKCIDCTGNLSPKSKRTAQRCRPCYLKHQLETREVATCHPDKKVFGLGLCQKCYYRARPPTPEIQRACHLRKKYGLTVDTFNRLVEKQGNRCAICREEFVKETDTNIDHCHTTGRVRGVLCRWCNIGLGNFKDNVELLQEAVSYLVSRTA